MRIGVLGPLQVLRDGVELDLGGRKQRILLASLALTPNRVVSADALTEMVWRDWPPPMVTASLHGYVAALRRVLEPGRAARDRPQVLLTRPPGYELHVGVEDLDASSFTVSVSQADDRLAGPHVLALPEGWAAGDLAETESGLASALALWRGSPFAELFDAPAGAAERARLEGLRLVALQDLARVRLALGKHGAVAAKLDALIRSHPLREDLWALRALALFRGGRQGEALETLRGARSVLADELGIDPGQALQDLQLAILRRHSAGQKHRQTPPGPHAARQQDGGETAALTVAASPPPSVVRPDAARLPLIGRDAELEALDELVGQPLSGIPRVALLTGEPGVGKSRLTEALVDRASGRGFLVLVGRCSQDEGAPPLWPWVGLLRSLAQTWPEIEAPDLEATQAATSGSAPSSPADRFRTFDAVARLLVRLSDEHPLLLVFDDLHWADPSSLHLLRHLVEIADHGRLLLAVTRRSRPEPQGALAILGEALARRGALRLDLGGLAEDDIEALAEAATGTKPDPSETTDLLERTGGNPFFIVEVLRLGERRLQNREHDTVPAAVGEVIAVRVGQLPVPTQRLLRDASVLGRRVDLEVPGRLADRSPLDVLDELEPALQGGIVVDAPDGGLQFSHALVRDAVYGSLVPWRRQLRHADVARVMEEMDGSGRRLSENAQHWLRAGPSMAVQAWRAAAVASAHATRLQAHEEAADLLAAALASQEMDAAAGAGQRYDLLMARARACRASANSEGQRIATAKAVRLAHGAQRRSASAPHAASCGPGGRCSGSASSLTETATVSLTAATSRY